MLQIAVKLSLRNILTLLKLMRLSHWGEKSLFTAAQDGVPMYVGLHHFLTHVLESLALSLCCSPLTLIWGTRSRPLIPLHHGHSPGNGFAHHILLDMLGNKTDWRRTPFTKRLIDERKEPGIHSLFIFFFIDKLKNTLKYPKWVYGLFCFVLKSKPQIHWTW